jgi:hypothetical protein
MSISYLTLISNDLHLYLLIYKNEEETKSYIFCDITPCSPLTVNRRLGGTYRLHIKGQRITQVRNQSLLCLPSISYWLLARLILQPWKRRRHVPPKRRLTFNWLHGVISQVIELFVSYYLINEMNANYICSKGEIVITPNISFNRCTVLVNKKESTIGSWEDGTTARMLLSMKLNWKQSW